MTENPLESQITSATLAKKFIKTKYTKSSSSLNIKSIILLEMIPNSYKLFCLSFIALLMFIYLCISILAANIASNLHQSNKQISSFPLSSSGSQGAIMNFNICSSINSDFDNRKLVETNVDYSSKMVPPPLTQFFKEK